MLPDSIVSRIQTEVTSWPGVTVEAHRGGMVFFQLSSTVFAFGPGVQTSWSNSFIVAALTLDASP